MPIKDQIVRRELMGSTQYAKTMATQEDGGGSALEPSPVEQEEGSVKSTQDPVHNLQSAPTNLESLSEMVSQPYLTMCHSTLLSMPNQMIASLPFTSREGPQVPRPGALASLPPPAALTALGNYELRYLQQPTGELPTTNGERAGTSNANNVPQEYFEPSTAAGFCNAGALFLRGGGSPEPQTSIRVEAEQKRLSSSRPVRIVASLQPSPLPLPGVAPSKEIEGKNKTRRDLSTCSSPTTEGVRRNEGSPRNVTITDSFDNQSNKKSQAYQPCNLILQRQQRAAVAKVEKRHPEYFDWTDPAIQLSPLPSDVAARRRSMFPWVLYRLLETAHYANLDKICCWEPHGRSFAIISHQVFAQVLMPLFFGRSTKYDSFRRQLNLYGFLRINSPKNTDEGAYYHEMFLRGRPEFCSRIERIKINGAVVRAMPSHDSEPDFGQFPTMPLFASAVPRRIHLSQAYVGLMHLGAQNHLADNNGGPVLAAPPMAGHHLERAPEPGGGEEMSEALKEENDNDDLSLSSESEVAMLLDMAADEPPVENSQQGSTSNRAFATAEENTLTVTMICHPEVGQGGAGHSDHMELSTLTMDNPYHVKVVDGGGLAVREGEAVDLLEEQLVDMDHDGLVVAPLTDEDQHQLTALLQNKSAVADLFHFP